VYDGRTEAEAVEDSVVKGGRTMCDWVRSTFHGDPLRRGQRWCTLDRLYRSAEGVFGVRTRWTLRAALAVATVFALAVLFRCTHGRSGITFGQIVAACKRAENVHVTTSCPRTGEVAYEMWISSEMNLLAMTRGREHTVYDLGARRKRRTDLASGQTESGPLSDREYAGVKRMATLYPGSMLIDAPSDARWHRSPDRGGQKIYELTQTHRTSNGHDYRIKFEVAMDGLTRLPQTLRLFHNGPMTEGWECMSQTTFEYPAGAKMKSLIQNASGASRPREIDRPG